MFRLATPITCTRPVSDFDDISTILTHSSLSGSQKGAPWQQYVGEDGQVFYVELNHPKPTHHHTCTRPVETANNTCALCSTRSCRSCASEDTGYSSDTDALPPPPPPPSHPHSRRQRCEQAVLDLSCDSGLFNSKTSDADDKDDGVSVDLTEFDRLDLMSVINPHSVEDDGRCGQFSHQCRVHKSETRSRYHHSCTRTASLCERHSNKLYTSSEKKVSGLQSEAKACHCVGHSTVMSSGRTKPQEACSKEVTLRLGSKEQSWDYQAGRVDWLESVLGIVPGGVDSRNGQRQDSLDSDGVVIKGLVPEGLAARSKKLFVGDCIESINGKQVRWKNLTKVISSLHQTKKIRLGVRQPSSSQSHLSSRLLLDTHSVPADSSRLPLPQTPCVHTHPT